MREAAAVAFDALFKAGASSVVDSVIPDLMHKLEQEKESEKALEGLRVILSIRPHTLEGMMPKLLKEPISMRRVVAIGSLAEVAPGSLRTHLALLMRSFMKLGSQSEESELTDAARESAKQVHKIFIERRMCLYQVVLVFPEEHLQTLVNELKKGLEEMSMRFCAALLISTLASSRSIGDHVESLFQALVPLMSEDDPVILKECWNALKAVAGTVAKELRPTYVRYVILIECIHSFFCQSFDRCRGYSERKRKKKGPYTGTNHRSWILPSRWNWSNTAFLHRRRPGLTNHDIDLCGYGFSGDIRRVKRVVCYWIG